MKNVTLMTCMIIIMVSLGAGTALAGMGSCGSINEQYVQYDGTHLADLGKIWPALIGR